MTNVLRHGAVWLALWAFWVFASRDHHPTLFIAMVATAFLMLASALAFYANRHLLMPHFWQRGQRLLWAVAFAALVALLAVITAQTISLFYDAAWGPDPARYGFAANVAMEAAWITLHALGGAFLLWLLARRRPHTAV